MLMPLSNRDKHDLMAFCHCLNICCRIINANQEVLFSTHTTSEADLLLSDAPNHLLSSDDSDPIILSAAFLESSRSATGDCPIDPATLITDHITGRNAARSHEDLMALFKTALDLTDQATLFISTKGIIRLSNKAAKHLLHPSEDLEGTPITEWIDFGESDPLSNQTSTRIDGPFRLFRDDHALIGDFTAITNEGSEGLNGTLIRFTPKHRIPADQQGQSTTPDHSGFDDIIGNSPAIKEVKNQAARLRKGSSTILINGESGTGKEMFAKAIHYSSDRRTGPFIAINCAAIPDNLLESELFGYEEGAFTGAKKGGKAGKFELAHRGTLFLDEIGDLKITLQAKLLRVLQENAIERIGGKKSIPIDVRIISATHDELHEKVDSGEFRADLFYRLSVVPIRIPSLRERREDILTIAEFFLEHYSKELDKAVLAFSDAVRERLQSYLWPGNVRELENVVEFAVNMAQHTEISLSDLPSRFVDASHRSQQLYPTDAAIGVRPVSELEKNEILKAINLYGRHKEGMKEAADRLGLSLSTLYRRLKKFEID